MNLPFTKWRRGKPAQEVRKSHKNANDSLIVDIMPVEVRAGDGTLLFTGRLDSFSLAQVSISRIPGTFALPVLDPGTPVTICGYNNDMEIIRFDARVRGSSMFGCCLEGLRMIPENFRRSAVRLPMFNKPAELYVRPYLIFLQNQRILPRWLPKCPSHFPAISFCQPDKQSGDNGRVEECKDGPVGKKYKQPNHQ